MVAGHLREKKEDTIISSSVIQTKTESVKRLQIHRATRQGQ